jgi:cytochrome c oxidase cbb3-type subunit III
MKPKTPVLANITVILVVLSLAFYTFNESFSFLKSVYYWGTVTIAIVIALIHDTLSDLVVNKKYSKLSATEKQEYLANVKIPYLKRLFADASKKQTVEWEEQNSIDHGFDDIKELDNALPRWWLNLFYFGVVFGSIYFITFSFTDFARQLPEYEVDTREKLAMIAKYNEEVVQPTLETAQYSADNIAEGQELFKTNCVSCHNEGGKGGIGPNLTDKYWINQKANDVFHNVFWMLENGSPNNATMRAFIKNGEITGIDAQKIAAYIYHINQEQAPITVAQGGAAPQGTVAPWVK